MSTTGRTVWPVVLTAVLGGVVAALHVGKVSPSLPLIRAELGLDLVAGGFVVSIFNLLGVGLALVVGTMADRLGRVRLITAGFLGMALGGIGGAVSDGLVLLMISRFVEGIGFIGVVVALPAIVMAAASETDRPLALSLWSIFTPAGMALALVSAPPVLGLVGWRGLWIGVAVLCIVALIAVRRMVPRITLPAAPVGRSSRVMLEALARPGLLLLGGAFAAYVFQWVSLMIWLPTFLAADLGVSPATASLLTALVIVVNVPGNILSGWLLRRGVGPRLLISVGSLLMGLAGVGIFMPVFPDEVRLALCLIFSLAGGMIPACLFVGAAKHAPTPGHMGAANGILMQGSAIGQFIGPPTIAAAVAASGGAWSGALLPLAAGAGLVVVAGWLAGASRPSA